MKKKCEVVMLPTKKATWPNCIWLGRSLGILHLDKSYNSHYSCDPIDESMLPQHLYIVSDEEIKKGDWCVVNWGTNILGESLYDIAKCTKVGPSKVYYFDELSMCWGKHELKAKKIIATTDLSLSTILEPHIDKYGDLRHNDFSELPKPSEAFIKKYIREYNSGNQITEVMVEYDIFDEPTIDGDWERYRQYKLKVSKNNEVTITKIKDSWCTEDIKRAFFAGASFKEGYFKLIDGSIKEPDFEKWLNDNL